MAAASARQVYQSLFNKQPRDPRAVVVAVVSVVVDSGYVSGFKIGKSSPIPAQYGSLEA